MQRLCLLACASAVSLAATAAVAVAEDRPPAMPVPCMRSEELVQFLAENFAEVPMARGLSDGGVLVTVFAGKNGNTWTLAITQPSGVSCILSAGESFEFLPPSAALSASAAPT